VTSSTAWCCHVLMPNLSQGKNEHGDWVGGVGEFKPAAYFNTNSTARTPVCRVFSQEG
jgi:hypothetical protein